MSDLRALLERAYMQSGGISTGGLDRFSLTKGARIALEQIPCTCREGLDRLGDRTRFMCRRCALMEEIGHG